MILEYERMAPYDAEKIAATTDATVLFERLYATDLVYQPDCWKLCGDAHCCNFARHRSKFRILTRGGAQDLPLLPGEFEFLQAKGWQKQFQEFDRRRTPYDFGPATVWLDLVSSRRPGGCACDHDTRTVICRLYPLLPVFDVQGRVVGTEVIGMYEELERLDALTPACRLTAIPFEQMTCFLRLCELIASDPVMLFHVAAYRAAKRHVFRRIGEEKTATGKSAFALFEGAFLRKRLIDHAELKAELCALHASFEHHYGSRYTAAIARLRPPVAA
jgi:hypothetical protein